MLKVANTISARPSPVTEVPVPVLQSRRLAKRLITKRLITLGLVTRAMWVEFRLPMVASIALFEARATVLSC